MEKKEVAKWVALAAGAGAIGYGAVWAYRNPLAVARRYAEARMSAQGATERQVGYSDGTVRYYALGGDGPPVVIVHGLGDHPASWYPVTAALRDRYRVVVAEQPVHGRSTAVGGYTLEKAVNALDAVILAEFGGERVNIVGNSLGGWVAARYGLARPERVEQLILVNPGGMRFTIDPTVFLPQSVDEAKRAMVAVVGEEAQRYPKFIYDAFRREVWNGPTMKLLELLGDEPSLEDQAEGIRVPTHVVVGTADGMIPPDAGRRLAKLVPDATLDELEGAAHSPHVADVDALNEVLLRRLGEPEP